MYRYHPDHAWVKMEDDCAYIGLSFYAQAHLGEIVYVDLPPAGQKLVAGKVLGGIESAKTTSEVIAPIDGSVIESNPQLETAPELINESPLDKGWITKVKLDDPANIDKLMNMKAYEVYLSELPQDDE